MADNTAPDVKLLRTEVESLSARVQRLNAENDDLLQRLGEAKRLKEQRERQFEEEKNQLTKRIRELEMSLKNGDESVNEMKEKMANERKEHQVNQRVLCMEIDHLKSSLQAMTIELSEARAECDYIRRHTVSTERERELRKQVDELMTSLETETKSHHEATRTGQSEMSRLVDSEIELKRRLDEARRNGDDLRGQLEREKKRNQELQKDFDDLQKQRAATEGDLRAQVDRLSASLQSTERLLEETKNERKTLHTAKEELFAKLAAQDLDHQTNVERLASAISEKDRLIEELSWKKREMLTSIENLERNQIELKKALNDTRTRSQELEEKNGKLERAIIRQRFEKEQLVTKNREEMVGFDEDLRSLVREQVSHISDLQKEVNTLRSALKDSWRAGGGEAHGHGGANVHRNGQLAALSLQAGFRKAGGCDRPKRSPRRASLDQETIRLTKAAAAVTDVKGDDKDGARDELQKARYEIDVGARRIAQLEKWLDEIYNDRELGLGPGGKDVVGARAAVQQRPRGNVAAAAGLVALPDLTQPSLGGRPRGELHSEKPVWDFRTKLTAAVSKSAVHA